MISLDEAIKLVTENVRTLQTVRANLDDALGCASANDIRAQYPNPRFDNSQMDGYAVIAGDLAGASRANPATLEVIEDLPAGKISQKKLGGGQAIRIMTGAPLPHGADSVVAVEDTERAGNSVKIFHAPSKGEFVRFGGEDIKISETIIGKGKMIAPPEILALASQGIDEIDVVRRPKIAVIATGDELTTPGQQIKEGCIYNGSSSLLVALVKSAGGVAFDLGIARDDSKAIAEKLCEGLGFDMIIMTGGVSAGDYDLNRGVLEKMGWKESFWRVAIRPGKPLAFGTLEGKPVFGMPGNPISTMTAFELFVYPAIKKMMGSLEADSRRLCAKLAGDVERDKEREQLLLADLKFENGAALVTAHGPQSSAHLKPALSANCLARIPSGDGRQPAGSSVEIWSLTKNY